jgi:hypothetical protein
MKRHILAVALVLASASAMADRVVSGITLDGYGNSKPQACENAKKHAEDKAQYDEQVVGFSECECDKNENNKWSCTVNAKIGKKTK